MKIPRWIVKCVPGFIREPMRPIAGYVFANVKYSKKFYEEDYHSKDYALQEQNLDSLMERFTEMGQKAKLHEALDEIQDIPVPAKWLEVGCQFGKSVFWLADRYPETKFYMFDFAETAISFINKHNPIPKRTVVWRGDVSEICNKDMRFDDFFDTVSMLDITEHLPKSIYFKAIDEVFRVLKPGGYLLLKQGNEILSEHINIRWEWQLVRDFEKAGFRLEQRLPHRHYLMHKLA